MPKKTGKPSHAVAAQRQVRDHKIDNFPTPLWGTRVAVERALLKILPDHKMKRVYEPSAGAGNMCRALSEYYKEVVPSDLYDYGYPGTTLCSYLDLEIKKSGDIWMNPPFTLAKQFILKARKDTAKMRKPGIIMAFLRMQIAEGKDRYYNLFLPDPPSHEFVFVERLAMVEGRLDPDATTATAYVLLAWLHGTGKAEITEKHWLAPCKPEFNREGDWDEPHSSAAPDLFSQDLINKR